MRLLYGVAFSPACNYGLHKMQRGGFFEPLELRVCTRESHVKISIMLLESPQWVLSGI